MNRSLTDLRLARPDLGFAIYAYTPGGDVILEIHDAGETYQFRAATIEDAIEIAFPSPSEPERATPDEAAPELDIFN